MATKIKELKEKLDRKRGELAELFKTHSDENGGYKDSLTAEVAKELRTRNDELTELGKEYDSLVELEKIQRDNEAAATNSKAYNPAQPPVHGNGGGRGAATAPARKSVGQLFVDSKAGQNKNKDCEIEDFEVKTLFETGNGWQPETTRTGTVLLSPQRQPTLMDYIPQITTQQVAYVYMEETIFTNNAAETAEGGAYPEAALKLEEKSTPVKKVAVFIPVTDEQLEDVAGIQTYVESRLGLMLDQRIESQFLVGTGVGVNLLGYFNMSGMQSQAQGTDPIPDAYYKAMTKIEVVAQANPNLIIMHPNDWQTIRLLRTNQGVYIWGNPSDAGPERLWGLAVRKNQAVPTGKGGVMDTSYFMAANKAGIEFKVSDSHEDYFVKGKQAIRARVRLATVQLRQQAFCQVVLT